MMVKQICKWAGNTPWLWSLLVTVAPGGTKQQPT
jgi:hypothetical protein